MTRFRGTLILAIAAAAGLTLWGCAENGSLMSICGDGVKSLGEACDDGNLAPGDGCSPTCTVENATGLQPTLASIQQYVFGPICSSCHHSGGSVPSLDSIETSYAELVNVESFFCSDGVGGWATRVEPYQPDASCLVMMIEGAQGAGGLFMPPSPMRPLGQDEIDAIREWITRGANP